MAAPAADFLPAPAVIAFSGAGGRLLVAAFAEARAWPPKSPADSSAADASAAASGRAGRGSLGGQGDIEIDPPGSFA
jgi:hypothetical protein